MSGVKFNAATGGSTSLSDFYNDEVVPRLTAELVYDWPGHNWHRSPGKWRGACPIHTSMSGTSFNVTLDSLTWYCPACLIGGGPIQYLHWRRGGIGSPRGQDFVETLRELARLVGLALPEREMTDEERAAAEATATKRGALELVYRICQDHLWTDAGATARAYLHDRGIDDDGIRSLELGIYPPLQVIRLALAQAGYPTDIGTGAWWKLVGYVTFPWRDDRGEPLTLYGRWPGPDGWPKGREKTMALPGEGSKASPLYFDRLRRAGHRDAVLVEGLLDAAVAQVRGLTNVVAYVGGQPSHAQLSTLVRHRLKTATICPDPDKGGEGGILSFLRNVDLSIRAYVAPKLAEGMDPDQFILRQGVDGWRRHIAGAEPGHVWRARHILNSHDLEPTSGRDDAREELVGYARTLLEHERDDIVRVAADPLRMGGETLRRLFGGGDAGRDTGTGTTSSPVRTPIRVSGRDPRDVAGDAIAAIRAANDPEPRLFVRGGALVRVRTTELGRPLIEALDRDALFHTLLDVAHWQRYDQRTHDWKPAAPPDDVVRYISGHRALPFPALAGIAEAPILRPDGTLATSAGYDPVTRLIYRPSPDLQVPPIPERPTPDEVAASVALIGELLHDFSLADDGADDKSSSSRANAYGLLLTLLLRPAIEGPTPLAAINKNSPGAGATLLTEVFGMVAHGRAPGLTPLPADDAELEKRITTLLRDGEPLNVLDNVDYALEHGSLALVLTATEWAGRVLGRSESARYPNRAVWTANGVNLVLRGDIARRAYEIRIVVDDTQPWRLEGGERRFRHPDLMGWAKEHRGVILGSCFTLARNWYANGQPSPTTPTLGKFEDWCRVVGGVLEAAGIGGFLGNLDALYRNVDAESPEWGAFLAAWHERYGPAEVAAKRVETDLRGIDAGALLDALPGDLVAALSDPRSSFAHRLGKALAKRVDRRYGEQKLRIVRCGDTKGARWRVVGGFGGFYGFSPPHTGENADGAFSEGAGGGNPENPPNPPGDSDAIPCATCGVNAVELIGLDCDECTGA